jgi:hypothetical protein
LVSSGLRAVCGVAEAAGREPVSAVAGLVKQCRLM